jgi:hypothetical protein
MGKTASKNPNSIILNHCWICEKTFVEYGGDANKEEHH